MAFLTCAGIPCGAPSSITLPLTGRPHADLSLAVQTPPFKQGDRVSVSIQDGATYSMTVDRVGPRGGFVQARLICGTGGLSKDIPAKFYSGVLPGTVLKELLQACGEAPGSIDLPAEPLPMWIRAAGPANEALRALMMRYPQHVWTMAPDGKVNVSIPGWPEHSKEPRVEGSTPADGLWVTGIDGSLTAGVHVTMRRGDEKIGKRAARVIHSIQEVYDYPRNGVELRTHIGTGDGADQGVSGLEAVAQRALRWVDYLALFPCTVLRDHGNHTLDLQPENPLLPQMVKVRMIPPFAGARLKIKSGGTVLLTFQAGDPARPLVLSCAGCTPEFLSFETGKGQSLTIDDDRGQVSPDDTIYAKPFIRLQDQAGQLLELWAQKGREKVTLMDKAGQGVTLDPVLNVVSIISNGTLNVETAQTLNLDGALVNIAGGGQALARVGDQVDPVTHIIISGSSRVRSG